MINRVILVGNLTADPELRTSTSGTAVCNLRLATNVFTGKDADGNPKEVTDYHRLVAFGATAELSGEHLRKGRLVYAEGRLHTHSWDADDGSRRHMTEVVVDTLKVLGPRPQEAAV